MPVQARQFEGGRLRERGATQVVCDGVVAVRRAATQHATPLAAAHSRNGRGGTAQALPPDNCHCCARRRNELTRPNAVRPACNGGSPRGLRSDYAPLTLDAATHLAKCGVGTDSSVATRPFPGGQDLTDIAHHDVDTPPPSAQRNDVLADTMQRSHPRLAPMQRRYASTKTRHGCSHTLMWQTCENYLPKYCATSLANSRSQIVSPPTVNRKWLGLTLAARARRCDRKRS